MTRQTEPLMNDADGVRGPVRMCVICRQRFPKRELLRFTLNRDGSPEADHRQVHPGRGWYVCGRQQCRDKLGKYRPAGRHMGRKKNEREKNKN